MTPFFFFSQRLDKHNPGVSTGDISIYSYHNQGFVSRAAKRVITGTIKLDFCGGFWVPGSIWSPNICLQIHWRSWQACSECCKLVPVSTSLLWLIDVTWKWIKSITVRSAFPLVIWQIEPFFKVLCRLRSPFVLSWWASFPCWSDNDFPDFCCFVEQVPLFINARRRERFNSTNKKRIPGSSCISKPFLIQLPRCKDLTAA